MLSANNTVCHPRLPKSGVAQTKVSKEFHFFNGQVSVKVVVVTEIFWVEFFLRPENVVLKSRPNQPTHHEVELMTVRIAYQAINSRLDWRNTTH